MDGGHLEAKEALLAWLTAECDALGIPQLLEYFAVVCDEAKDAKGLFEGVKSTLEATLEDEKRAELFAEELAKRWSAVGAKNNGGTVQESKRVLNLVYHPDKEEADQRAELLASWEHEHDAQDGSLLNAVLGDGGDEPRYVILKPGEMRYRNAEYQAMLEPGLSKLFNSQDGDEIEFTAPTTALMMKWRNKSWKSLNQRSHMGRSSHSAVVIEKDDFGGGSGQLLLLLGGADGGRRTKTLSEGVLFDPVKEDFAIIPFRGKVDTGGRRRGHTCVLLEGHLIVVGGINARGERIRIPMVGYFVNESLQEGIWHEIAERSYLQPYGTSKVGGLRYAGPGNDIPHLSHHTCVVRAKTMYIFGGSAASTGGGQYSNELYTFTIHFGTLPRWSRMGGKKRKIPFNWVKQVKRGDVPPPRAGHTATLVDFSRMVVVGGIGMKEAEAAVYEYVFDMSLWIRRPIIGIPPLAYHSATLVGSGKIILFGGFVNGVAINTVYILDTIAWNITIINIPGGLPSPRGSHTASLMGEQLWISSGFSDVMTPDWYAIDNPYDSSGYSSSLGADLATHFDNPRFADIKFLGRDTLIHCHKIVLASRCTKFREIFSSGEHLDVIRIEKFSFAPFRAFLKYLYSDKLECQRFHARELIQIAAYYQIPQLKAMAENFFEYTPIPASSLQFNMIWATEHFSFHDVICSVEGVEMPAHRFILSSRSSFFKALFVDATTDFVELQTGVVVLQDIDAAVARQLFRFIYSETLELNDIQGLFDLFCQSQVYGVRELIPRLEQALLPYIDADNVGALLTAADMYRSELMKERCVRFLLRQWDSFDLPSLQLPSHLAKELHSRHGIALQLYNGGEEELDSDDDYIYVDSTATYIDEEGVPCSVCQRPFVWNRKTWPDGLATPRDCIEKKMRGKKLVFSDVIDEKLMGHLVSLIVDAGPDSTPLEFKPQRAYGTKKDAQQNASLLALHCIECGSTYGC